MSFNPHRLLPAGATCTSPAPKPWPGCFNPHRLLPAGATCNPGHGCRPPLPHRVSTLTGCCQPVQPGRPCPRPAPGSCFNPHRLLPAGATPRQHPGERLRAVVSTLTGCCQPVQQAEYERQIAPLQAVSTLTGCCQPVQHVTPGSPLLGQYVSTLTGCCQPVQRRRIRAANSPAESRFNPHRLLPAGATRWPPRLRATLPSFNPHRLLPAGATSVMRTGSVMTRPASFNPHRLLPAGATPAGQRALRNAGFNPHRLLPAGATSAYRSARYTSGFQPSPAVASRCNRDKRLYACPCYCFNPHRLLPAGATLPGTPPASSANCRLNVSAFAVSAGFNPHRLLPAGATERALESGAFKTFQPSPAVASRCNLNVPASLSAQLGFNPHRLLPAGATVRRLNKVLAPRQFQPSPAVASRCNTHCGYRRRKAGN